MKIFWFGLTTMFILIRISAVIGYYSMLGNIQQFKCLAIWGWTGGFVGVIIGLIILFFIIWVLSWIFRALSHSGTFYSGEYLGRWDNGKPVEILMEMYAKGEITKEQYYQMFADLEKGRGR